MNPFVAQYHQEAQAYCSDLPWLATMQQQAQRAFCQLGFPKKSDEDWKYTRVDVFNQRHFFVAANTPVQNSVINPSALGFSHGCAVNFVNGHCQSVERHSDWPADILMMPLSEALNSAQEKIQPYLNKILAQQHGFHALNTAFIGQGLFIYVPRNVRCIQPLLLSHVQQSDGSATYLRHVVVLEEHSALTIIEDYVGHHDICYFTNSICEVNLEKNATLTHLKIQRESQRAFHIGHMAVKQGEASTFNSHAIHVGAGIGRSDIDVRLGASAANCLLNGIYAPMQGQHIDHHTSIWHDVPNCHSQQDYKGIIEGRAVFNGRVIVAKNAQKTDAQQQNKNILLSTKAEIDTKPQLEIFADDVVCSHGATVGQLDEDALFYLASRGLTKDIAKLYLVKAFTAKNLALLANLEWSACVEALICQQLGWFNDE